MIDIGLEGGGQRAKEETEGKTSNQRARESGRESEQGEVFQPDSSEAREARCETIGATGGETGGGYRGWAVLDRDRRCESGPETESWRERRILNTFPTAARREQGLLLHSLTLRKQTLFQLFFNQKKVQED